MNKAKLLLAAQAAMITTAATASITLLHDPLNDTVRNVQNLPHESAWYKGGGGNITLTPTTDGLEFTRSDAGTSRLLATNFVDSTNGYTLAIGETLRMEYTFQVSAVPTGSTLPNHNRMSLLSFANASSQRLSADNSSANGPTVTNLSGYMFTFHISDTLATTPLQLYKVNSAATGSFSSIGSFTTIAGQTTETAATGGMVAGTNYTLRLDIARTAASAVDLTLSYLDSGGGVIARVVAEDSNAPAITYDGFVYRASEHASFGGTQTIKEFSVVVVPEPSTYAVLLGLTALGLVIYRRRLRG